MLIPTVSKVFQPTKKEQSSSGFCLIWLKLGKKAYKCPNYEKLQLIMSETLENYANNNLFLQLESHSFNFIL